MSQKDHENIKKLHEIMKTIQVMKTKFGKNSITKRKSNLSKLQNKKLNRKPRNRLNEAEERISGLEDKVEEIYSLVKKS